MSQLQKLLDEKWPLAGLDKQDTYWANSYREAFTEGYNAAMQEIDRIRQDGLNPDNDRILIECANLRKRGLHLECVKYYKDNMGCSLAAAMEAVGPKSAFAQIYF